MNIKIRMSNHQRNNNNIPICNNIVNIPMSNNMFQHIDETSHSFALNNGKILHSEKNRFPRKIIEAADSKINANSINRAMEILPCYYTILK